MVRTSCVCRVAASAPVVSRAFRLATSSGVSLTQRIHGALPASGMCSAALPATPLLVQRRTQYAQTPGKRDQEAYLSQYDPMEVLGLDTDCTVEEIDEAFTKKAAKYGSNGSHPDPKMVDRVFRAHEILKDPDSPYYLKAHSTQTDRQRLQFQLLPKNKRRLIEFQVGILMMVALGIFFLLISLVLRPLKRSLRAAIR